MEPTDNANTRKGPLEEMSREDLIKKCSHLLMIAKKAKQSRDETSEELKRSQENENKLSNEITVLKEVMESITEKQKDTAEVQNKLKATEDKNIELLKALRRMEENHASKILECTKLSETLQKLSTKISELEIVNSENKEKMSDFKESYAKLDIENKLYLEKLLNSEKTETELRQKLQSAEEKYTNLEQKLSQFQENYLEERKNHEDLQETLCKLQSRASSERPSPDRPSLYSSDSLRSVAENQEYDELLEKFNSLSKKYEEKISDNEAMTATLRKSENLLKDWSSKCEALTEQLRDVPENFNEVLAEKDKLIQDFVENEKECRMKLEEELKNRELQCANEKLIQELKELNKSLNEKHEMSKKLNEKLAEELQTASNDYSKLMQELDEARTSLNQQTEEKADLEKRIQEFKGKLQKMSIKLSECEKELLESNETSQEVCTRFEESQKELFVSKEASQKLVECERKLWESKKTSEKLNEKLVEYEKEVLHSKETTQNLSARLEECEKELLANREISEKVNQKLVTSEKKLLQSKEMSQNLSERLIECEKELLKSRETSKELSQKLVESGKELLESKEASQNLAKSLADSEKEIIENREKLQQLSVNLLKSDSLSPELKSKYEEQVNENKKLLRILEEERKQNSKALENEKMYEKFLNDKNTEEMLKETISKLNLQLVSLRDENTSVDNKYKEMESKLKKSRTISEELEKLINEKCDEYDNFKKQIEWSEAKVKELTNNLETVERDCETLRQSEAGYLTTIGELKDIESKYLKLVEENKTKNQPRSKAPVKRQTEDDYENDKKFFAEVVERYSQSSDGTNFAIDSQQLIQDFVQTSQQLKSLRDKSEKKLLEKEQEIVRLRKLNSESVPHDKTGSIPKQKVEESQKTNKDSLNKVLEEFSVLKEQNEKLKEENECLKIGRTKGTAKNEHLLKDVIRNVIERIHEVKKQQNNFKRDWLGFVETFQMEQQQTGQVVAEAILEFTDRLQTGNSELLSEMNDMNQALKERGEVISKLEQVNENKQKEILESSAKIASLDGKLAERKKKLEEVEEESGRLKLELEGKVKAMRDMEEEIWRLKSNDSQTEALSTSTISKVEETARLADLEESFEERYSKLKVVALKLKKKVSELQNQLEDERKKLVNERSEYQGKITHFQTQVKSLNNLQLEYDKLQDLLDEEKKEKSSLKKSLELIQQEAEIAKQRSEEMRGEKEKFKNEKSSFEIIKKELTGQILALKKSIEKEQNRSRQLEKEIERMEGEMKLRDKRVEEESERHKKTLSLLEEQKMESKKHSVLSLEMADYERTVTELSKKLEMKEVHVLELESHLETQRELSRSHQETISRLESTVTTEQQRADEANNQIKLLNQDLCDLRSDIKEKLSAIGHLEQVIEEKKSEIETLSLQFANVSKENQQIEEKRRSIQEQLSRQIHYVEDKLSSVQDTLSQKEMELSELKKEFEGYKVRAQSVLRQSQKDTNPSKQQNTLEELEHLKSTSDSLKARLEDSSKKMQNLVEENGIFLEEKTRLYTRVQELTNAITELREQNQELKEARLKENEGSKEIIRMQKLQSDTLAQCYQKQIEDLETKYKTEMKELKKEHEQLQIQFQLHLDSDVSAKRDDLREHHTHRRTASANFVPVKSERELLDVMMLEREECEGSESVDSTSSQPGGNNNSNNNNLIPLDQLLNNSDQLEQTETKKSPIVDYVQLNEKLEKSDNRIKHLTMLLSDAESDSARLKQLNDVLKEEIRRNQRSVEREKHAQNFEYLKNVVLKFISLQNVDEKLRLVPVLNTILKLSPEEENVLSNAARGILEHPGSVRGWGSYLNLWPSAQ